MKSLWTSAPIEIQRGHRFTDFSLFKPISKLKDPDWDSCPKPWVSIIFRTIWCILLPKHWILHDLFTMGFNGKTLAVWKLLATSVIIQECFKTCHELQLLLFLRQLAFKWNIVYLLTGAINLSSGWSYERRDLNSVVYAVSFFFCLFPWPF